VVGLVATAPITPGISVLLPGRGVGAFGDDGFISVQPRDR
jgi:hypothetical protein